MRPSAILAAALGLAGCGLAIDPDKVKPPVECVSTGCGGLACGASDNCGNPCTPGSGCTITHVLEGGLGPGAGPAQASAAGGHALRRGTSAASAGAAATAGGHAVSEGRVSQ
jgi:hypothetical protein